MDELKRIKDILEAALLVAGEPVAVPQLARMFDPPLEEGVIVSLLMEIQKEWVGKPVELALVASGWRFQGTPAIQYHLDRLSPEKPPRYSRAVMETLAIIAYQQPVTRGDIEAIRGVAVSTNVIKTLEDRQWVEVVGHRETPGRPALYATTKTFLDDLGFRALSELPPLAELDTSHLLEMPDAPTQAAEAQFALASPILAPSPTRPAQPPSLALQRIAEGLGPVRHKSSTDEVFTEPQRLHKVLASCGFGSRRAMEELIIAGRITVNREPADVGQKVGPGDEVRINGELVKVRFSEPRVRILMYHKPAGEIVTRDDPERRPTVFEQLPNIGNGKWIAVGRLDFNTEGLLLFSNSGELANKMMHPRYEVEREYAVRVLGTLSDEQKQSLLTGITLEDGPANVEKIDDGGGEGANHWYHVVVKEGRNREVRRLFEALGLTVSRLIRTRYGPVTMPSRVKRAQTLELNPEEVGAVLAAAGMKSNGLPQNPEAGGKPRGHGGRDRGRNGGAPRAQQPGPQDHDNVGNRDPDAAADEPEVNGNTVEVYNRLHGPHAQARPAGQGSPRPRHGQGQGGPRKSNGPGGQRHNLGPGGPPHAGGPPHGQRGGPPRHGQGQAHGTGGQHPAPGRPLHGKGRPGFGKPRNAQASPYVTTTLTIPGAVPEGLPGTNPPRPRGPGKAGAPGGPGGGQGKNRGRGNRNRRGPKPDASSLSKPESSPGNEAPRAVDPTPNDEDFNR